VYSSQLSTSEREQNVQDEEDDEEEEQAEECLQLHDESEEY